MAGITSDGLFVVGTQDGAGRGLLQSPLLDDGTFALVPSLVAILALAVHPGMAGSAYGTGRYGTTLYGGATLATLATAPSLGVAAHPALTDTTQFVMVSVLPLGAHPTASDLARLVLGGQIGVSTHPGFAMPQTYSIAVPFDVHPAIAVSGVIPPVVWMPILIRRGDRIIRRWVILDRTGR